MIDPIAQLGEAVLNQVATPVGNFDAELEQLIKRMLAAMTAANGVGIAAPQIFVQQRVIIVASRPSERYPDAPLMAPVVMVNPVLETVSTDTAVDWEGCLSVPGIRGQVRRHQKISVNYQDQQGRRQQLKLTDFVARIVQHEVDHLDGLSFVDRVESSKHLIATSVWEQRCH